jgi:uncharacterized surface protein with fasciclin (FAS1) repeats
MINFRIATLALLFSGLMLTSCEDETSTVVDVVGDREDLSLLAEALAAADLEGTLNLDGPYTLFAPTDAAFQAVLDANNLTSVSEIPGLSNILLNHVVGGTNLSTDLATGYVETSATAQGANVNMFINTDGGVTLNGGATVTEADIDAENGVVHVVNQVITLPTVVDFATADPTFSTLVAALTRESDFTFVSTLSGEGPFTVFAPTNDAFGNVLAELNLTALGDIPTATLASTLATHVVAGANVRSSSLSDQQQVETLGSGLTVVIEGEEVRLIDPSGRASVVGPVDVQAANGVIHVLNTVLLP